MNTNRKHVNLNRSTLRQLNNKNNKILPYSPYVLFVNTSINYIKNLTIMKQTKMASQFLYKQKHSNLE